MKLKKIFKIISTLAFSLLLSTFATAQTISVFDKPDGFASVDAGKNIGGSNGSSVTVKTAQELKNALKKGRQTIYIDGLIDVSEGLLSFTENQIASSALDDFVKSKTSGKFSTYNEFVEEYVKVCTNGTDDTSSGGSSQSSMYSLLWILNRAYSNVISLKVPSNVSIIGISSDAGIRGGSIKLQNVNNIVIRNIQIIDAVDPFPHHEKNDGFNAEQDGISIESATNIWIDHCTLMDTKNITNVRTGGTVTEKWQIFDGLCDIKGNSKNITVSYCHFKNHDKTMLIGSSDSESISTTRTITIHHNYFDGCKQRLPMVRLSNIHIYNNYYNSDSPSIHPNNYGIGVRYNSNIVSENNYFGEGIKYSVEGTTSKKGILFSSGDVDKSMNKKRTEKYNASSTKTFEIPYEYTLDDAKNLNTSLPKMAGSGVLSVTK